MKRLFIVCTLFLFQSGYFAADRSYTRAQSLLEDDPLEADAILADILKTTPHAKLRRAVKYDLFYLRLRLARFSEAYPLATGKGMRKKFITEAAGQFGVTEGKLTRVLAKLDANCTAASDLTAVTESLVQTKATAALYDFALRRLEACKAEEPLRIFPVLGEESGPILESRLVNIYLVKARALISAGEYETAREGLTRLGAAAEKLIADKPQLAVQLMLTQARESATSLRSDEVNPYCTQIAEYEGFTTARQACTYLRGYALLKQGKSAEAAKILLPLKAEPHELDNRLLKLCAAVSVKRQPAEKLRRFTHRASYRYQARVLRDLAAEILQ